VDEHRRRTRQGFYLPARFTDDSLDQRIVDAAATLPEGGAVTGWASFAWRGDRWFEGFDDRMRRLPVQLAIGESRLRPQPGIAHFSGHLPSTDCAEVDGLTVTTPLAAAALMLCQAPNLRAAVKLADLALATDRVSRGELWRHLHDGRRRSGCTQARLAVRLADENVWSPMESEMRWEWRRIPGVTTLMCNRPIFDLDGHHVATPDLFDPVAGLAGEYDGSDHFTGRQRHRDLRREERLRSLGIEVVTMVGPDRHNLSTYRDRVAEARQRALASVTGPERRWTVATPAHWTDTFTVDSRRRLTPGQQARWLRNRAA
jgi:hypothetical protein